MSITDRLHDLDHRQQGAKGVRFIAAVIKKFQDDQAGQLAALISYYGFVSLFPLLLVFVTILGFVLEGDPDLQKKILDGTLGQFPLLSDSLKLHSLGGSPAALAIGVIGALLAGLGIMNATHNAMDRIWAVPFKNRSNFLTSKLRGLAMFAVLGTLAVASTVAAGFVGAASHGTAAVVGGVARSPCVQPDPVRGRLQAADLGGPQLERTRAGHHHRHRLLADAPAPRRVLPRPHPETDGPAVRHLRRRSGTPGLALPRAPS